MIITFLQVFPHLHTVRATFTAYGVPSYKLPFVPNSLGSLKPIRRVDTFVSTFRHVNPTHPTRHSEFQLYLKLHSFYKTWDYPSTFITRFNGTVSLLSRELRNFNFNIKPYIQHPITVVHSLKSWCFSLSTFQQF